MILCTLFYIIRKSSTCWFTPYDVNDNVKGSENTPMRWSQARYLPGDYDAYDAFDEAGNPPVHLWTRYLRVEVPINWFAIFEEARRKQREWATHVLGQQQQQYHHHHHHHHAPIHNVMPMTTSPTATTGLTTGMMMGGTSGGFPPPTMHHHQQQSNNLDEDYSDHGTFSAAPSRSERLTSISSLPQAYSPPQSPTPSDASSYINPPLVITPDSQQGDNNVNHPPSLSQTTTTAASVQPVTTASPQKQEQQHIPDSLKQQQHDASIIASSSSPNTTSTAAVPAVPSIPTKPTKRRSIVGSTPSQQLELALGDLNFPHDDDRFSIHSDYQPNNSLPTSPISSTHQHHPPHNNNNNTWKKRSIKRMLGRSSNTTK
ncbi:hypothetical protein BC941DRAFT_409162 [Chlamydoabsidia padenii]|nr:hypothetical protein BC941DRAFT_409162 [Chlamydoabsidia padenii]